MGLFLAPHRITQHANAADLDLDDVAEFHVRDGRVSVRGRRTAGKQLVHSSISGLTYSMNPLAVR